MALVLKLVYVAALTVGMVSGSASARVAVLTVLAVLAIRWAVQLHVAASRRQVTVLRAGGPPSVHVTR
jgi:hypothetical protein